MTHPTDTAKSEELKACPICGGEGMVGATLDDFFYAMCAKDDCIRFDHYWSTEAEAIAAWNRRSSPPQNDAGGEGLPVWDGASLPITRWMRRNADRRNPDAFINTDPAYFASEMAAAIAALRTPMSELQALGQEFEAGEDRQGMSACNKCGKQYPSAPLGYHHKCGECSGICHPLPSAPSGEG
ncbi:Lar family restriction alleviation protein [Sphingobium fuliginis]|nr:Lar family restriction alleviation protein [Sphingobium fuliginis]